MKCCLTIQTRITQPRSYGWLLRRLNACIERKQDMNLNRQVFRKDSKRQPTSEEWKERQMNPCRTVNRWCTGVGFCWPYQRALSTTSCECQVSILWYRCVWQSLLKTIQSWMKKSKKHRKRPTQQNTSKQPQMSIVRVQQAWAAENKRYSSWWILTITISML